MHLNNWLRLFFVLILSYPVTGYVQAQDAGRFFRIYWFKDGIEHGNPSFNSRFRVNAPETSIHPTFGSRSEARGNGMMQIFVEEDIKAFDHALLYTELWGGHPGTTNKRVSINGRSTYSIPEVGTAADHCTHQYPTVVLKNTDLVNGYNAIQFACDRGSTFWGHFIVENAALLFPLPPTDSLLESTGLSGMVASVRASKQREDEFLIDLDVPERFLNSISEVTFQGFYEGYDENGDGLTKDWHGFTKDKKPVATLGTVQKAPLHLTWDTSMLPAQKDVRIRALISFGDYPDLVYVSEPLEGLEIADRNGVDVRLHATEEMPRPFWSRANNERKASIKLDVDPGKIERAELHVIIWDGGTGSVTNYFTLNGHSLKTAGAGRHDVLYSILPIDPSILREGDNEIKLLSDTDHHGLEVLLPGPVLAIRYRN